MAEWLITILGFIAILFIGIVRIVIQLKSLNEDLKFLSEYHNKFQELKGSFYGTGSSFIYTSHADGELLQWLNRNANKAQALLGHEGIAQAQMGHYIEPNYGVIVDTLQLFRNSTVLNAQVDIIPDAILRRAGTLENWQQQYLKNLKRPDQWFTSGVRGILEFPFVLLQRFGILSQQKEQLITKNAGFRVISGIASLIGFVSGVMGIITGWDQFFILISRWMGA